MTARLTPKKARVGMLVECVEAVGNKLVRLGERYRISALHNENLSLEGMPPTATFLARRFIPAEPASPALPALTPELLKALREWHACRISDARLYDAIEAAPGILAPPEQPAPTLPAMWCGADAFEGEE